MGGARALPPASEMAGRREVWADLAGREGVGALQNISASLAESVWGFGICLW